MLSDIEEWETSKKNHLHWDFRNAFSGFVKFLEIIFVGFTIWIYAI